MKFMKHLFILLITTLSTIFINAQEGHLCAESKIHHHQQLKSNTLNIHDISLTENYDVKFYMLDVNLERTSTDISGKVQIIAEALIANLDTVLFELHPSLTIDSIQLNGNTTTFTRQNTSVILETNLPQNSLFTIDIYYGGTPTPSSDWAGMSNNSSQSWGNQITWTLSEPFSAYHWFPCKQSLTDKADSVFVSVTTDTSNLAGSNGLLKNVVDLGNGKHRFEWESRYPIDYYLISIAIGKYIDYSIYANPSNASQPILVQNYIYDNPNTLPYFQQQINLTADYIEYFSELYGIYPFENEKYGHCMVPIGGGMEHQTMTSQGFFTEDLTVHELGHQWFGDYVTCGSWADIWLNEGFASYTEHLMNEHFNPGVDESNMQDRHTNIMSAPNGSVYVIDSLTDASIFSSRLSYDKGAAIIHTLRFLIDDDTTFFNVLQTYLNTYANSSATTPEFKAIAENVSGLNFTNFFNEWYYGEGFPTYSLEWNTSQNTVFLNLSHSTSTPTTTLFTNDIEVLLSDGAGQDTIVRLQVNSNSQFYSFPYAGNVTNVSLDPNNWIINEVGSITQNQSLVSVKNIELGELTIFPTNATDKITIDNPNEKLGAIVYSIDGRMIQRLTLQNGSTTLQMNDYSAGEYILSYGKNQAKKFNVIH